jgi:hypothetical protein
MSRLWGRLATLGPIVNRSIRVQPVRAAPLPQRPRGAAMRKHAVRCDMLREGASSNFDGFTTSGPLQSLSTRRQVPDLPSGQSQATCEVGRGYALPPKDHNK